jgi:hypothetical protein
VDGCIFSESAQLMAEKIATSPFDLATFVAAQTDSLIHALARKLTELQPHGSPITDDSSRMLGAKPRILAALFCLGSRELADNDPASNAKSFQLYSANACKELNLLQPDWRGPFTFESIIQQGVGLYLRDAPNLGELVRSKPDFVFAEEVNRIHESDDWQPLFILKAKIQILESLRVLTRDPAHVPLAGIIHDSLSAASNTLKTLRPDATVAPTD